jgi:hypothetical protein
MTTKKQAATLLILMLMGLLGLASAQRSTIIEAQVPFNFVANGKAMAAGKCTIEVLGISMPQLSISSGERHIFVLPASRELPNGNKHTAVVFHKYGDKYFLAGIKRAGREGYELPADRLEVELRAQNVTEQDFTLVASAR